MNKNTIMIIAAVLIALAAVGGFLGGMQYQKGNTSSNLTQGGNGTFRQRSGMMGQNGQNFRPVRGQVLSLDSNSLTVKLLDGSTKIIILSGNTAFLKAAKASQSDLKTGDTVNVIGTQNSDGSLTAQDVQINPLTNQGMMQNQGK